MTLSDGRVVKPVDVSTQRFIRNCPRVPRPLGSRYIKKCPVCGQPVTPIRDGRDLDWYCSGHWHESGFYESEVSIEGVLR